VSLDEGGERTTESIRERVRHGDQSYIGLGVKRVIGRPRTPPPAPDQGDLDRVVAGGVDRAGQTGHGQATGRKARSDGFGNRGFLDGSVFLRGTTHRAYLRFVWVRVPFLVPLCPGGNVMQATRVTAKRKLPYCVGGNGIDNRGMHQSYFAYFPFFFTLADRGEGVGT
jgi:hypothetical protein